MKYLKITNKNEVQLEAFTLVGASTKREDSTKIGMFGSGNKYALAYLKRNNYDVKIFSGETEFKININNVKFGDREIGVIEIGGKETSITTEMGPKWNLWQAIREFYSNADDEGEKFFGVVEETPTGTQGITAIYIPAEKEVLDFVANFNLYFSEDTNFLFKNNTGSILTKTGLKLNAFRKGIRCHEEEMESVFDYDLNSISLNESRLVTSTTTLAARVWKMLGECDNEVVIRSLLKRLAEGNVWEFNEYAEYWSDSHFTFSDEWVKVLKDRFVAPREVGGFVDELIIDKTYMVPTVIYKKIVRDLGSEFDGLKSDGNGYVKYKIQKKTLLEEDTINKALDFFETCGYEIQYDIEVVEFFVASDSKNAIRGMADQGRILLSKAAFDEGVYYVATIIYEEAFHLRTGESDNTRGMQNALIKDMMTYMKKQNGINL